MVGCLTFILLALSIIILVAADIIVWMFGPWQAGLACILPLIGFLIAYKYSVEMSIAPRDFWANPSWEIAKKKLSYAWYVAWGIYLFMFAIYAFVTEKIL